MVTVLSVFYGTFCILNTPIDIVCPRLTAAASFSDVFNISKMLLNSLAIVPLLSLIDSVNA